MVTEMPDVGPWRRLESGGKAGGASSLLPSPNISVDPGLAKASGRFGSGWSALARLKKHNVTQARVWEFLQTTPETSRLPAFTSAENPAAQEIMPCGSCMNGTCVNGTCICWRGFRGACDLPSSEPGERPPSEWFALPTAESENRNVFGVNPSGISYWSREITLVDVMKASYASWTPQTHTDSTWDTGANVMLQDDGYPAFLEADQAVGSMMLRDLEENAEDGAILLLAFLTSHVTPSRITPEFFCSLYCRFLRCTLGRRRCAKLQS